MHIRSNWTHQDWKITVTLVLSQGSGGKEVSSTETTAGKLGSQAKLSGRHGIMGPMGLVIWISTSRWMGEGQGRGASHGAGEKHVTVSDAGTLVTLVPDNTILL